MTIFDLLHENAVQDNDLLQKNNGRGDTFDTPRNVDFAFKTDDRQKANDLAEFLNGKNFGEASVRQKQGDEQIWVVAVIHMPTNQSVLCCVSGFMLCVSRLFQVEYDGWGCVLQST